MGAPTTGSQRPSRRIRPWHQVVLAGCAVAILISLALTRETLGPGPALPEGAGESERLRFYGAIEVLIYRDPSSIGDLISGGILFAIAGYSVMLVLALRELGSTTDRLWFYGLLAAGATYLGLDEVVGLHETIGATLGKQLGITGDHSVEDVVIALYSIPTAIFVWRFRRIILGSRIAVRFIALAVALYVWAAILDLTDLFEENYVEMASMGAMFAGFLHLGLKDLTDKRVRQGPRLNGAPPIGSATPDTHDRIAPDG